MLTPLDLPGVAFAARIDDAASGLRAFLVLDDETLGPAAGGVRTWRYASDNAALADARALASAMTEKCALAGLDAGGGKCVVVEHAGLDRARAFAVLGAAVESLGGRFRTAGDLGTSAGDLAVMAAQTRFVERDEAGLAAAVARGLVACVRACVAERGGTAGGGGAWAAGRGGTAGGGGLRVLVQGAGAIGGAVAVALARAGAVVLVADVDGARARSVAEATGGRVVPAEDSLLAEVDVVAPCAVGGVITEAVAARLTAWAVCGAANRVLADSNGDGDGAAHALAARGILHVPDSLASAGAVIEGIGASVMGLADRTPLIDALGDTAYAVLAEARRTGRLPVVIARERARARIAAAQAHRT